MNKKTNHALILGITLILQLISLAVGVEIDNENISTIMGLIFFLLIPVNFVLFIIVVINIIKNKKTYYIPNTKNISQRDTLKSYIIEFPFYGVRGDGDEAEEVYYDGKEAYKWFNDSIIDAINISWNGSGMTDFISEKELKKKLQDMQLFTCKDGTCKIIISIFEELTETEKDYLLNFVKGQASDGWGEGNFDFEDNNGKLFRVTFWQKDNHWYIKYLDKDISVLLFDKFKKLTEKECYEIELLEEEPDIKDNKIGGVPYLPIKEEYPKDGLGKPMALLLQVNLKDIKLDNFPNKGILEIFVNQHLMGIDNNFIVKYYEDNLEYQKDSFPTIDKNEFILQKNYKINLKKAKSYMSFNDFRFENTIKDIADSIMKDVLNIDYFVDYDIDKTFGDILNKYFNESGVYNPKICIGGYADFTQTDPREDLNIQTKTECLFKLDSTYDLDKICIGDAGIIFALISPEDLKKKEFDKSYVDWDCC